MLSDALDALPDSTPAKETRADRMAEDERAGRMPDAYSAGVRWIGALAPKPPQD
jgi:hypothetical protein